MIKPHGGTLLEHYISPGELQSLRTRRDIDLTDRLLFDALMIAIGGYTPLNGFLSEDDYTSVVQTMRLKSGRLFAIPIVLPVTQEHFNAIQRGETIVLRDRSQNQIGVIEISGKFRRDLKKEAKSVYGTLDAHHSGVQKIYEEGEYTVSGAIKVDREKIDVQFPSDFLTPSETRAYFEKRGWRTVTAFQTRNPIHRAHEYLTKVALEMTDGLMIHPIVGEVKADDIPAAVRMKCYKTLIEKYYNKNRVLLNVLPMAMRYAGPREAIHHAIIRQNYGCTHIIIGRDHAGVGDYYGTYDAQRIFHEIEQDDLQIAPIMFDHAFFCRKCKQMVSVKTCPHDERDHLFFSGTRVREMLKKGQDLPEEFTRREISDTLRNSIA